MSGGLVVVDAFMPVLPFLLHIESWHLVAAGAAGNSTVRKSVVLESP
jgi:hypothetical protein